MVAGVLSYGRWMRQGVVVGLLSSRVCVVAAGVLVGVLLGSPAAAHTADAPPATDFQVRVGRVPPALAGVTVRPVEAGASLELRSTTRAPVEVLGYSGEPYLEIRADGVYQNANSPATYLNESFTGGHAAPAGANVAAAPTWRRIATEPVIRWHDHRVHWMSSQLPPQVQADPSRSHRIRTWVVPLRRGVTTSVVSGTLDWVPPPAASNWWAAAIVFAGLVAGLGLAATGRAGRYVVPALAVTLMVAGLVELVDSWGRATDLGDGWTVLSALLLTQTLGAATSVAALAAAGYAVTRRPAAEFALALSAGAVALFGALPDIGAFTHAITPLPWPGWWVRLATATTLGVGVGVAAAATVLLRRTAAAGKAQAVDPA